MRNKAGIFCMVLGAALFFGALSLFLYNEHEAVSAERSAAAYLEQLVAEIEVRQKTVGTEPLVDLNIPLEYLEPEDLEMTEVEIDGYGYIGYLSIPALELELPVMADWDYPRLRIAPCRYTGTVRGEDLVLMAHNYARHFGGIAELAEGDSVLFTDMDGRTTAYQVVARDVLDPTAVAEMTAGDFDLTLFTCTYGGQSRVTVYCDRQGR